MRSDSRSTRLAASFGYIIAARRVILLLALVSAAVGLQSAPAGADEKTTAALSLDSPPLSPGEITALRNPIPNSEISISRGRNLFAATGCMDCHGKDGKALTNIVANATDLTNPKVWKNGSEEAQIFRTIRDGAGVGMPPFRGQLTREEELWNLVNFIRSLWPAETRPPVAPPQ